MQPLTQIWKIFCANWIIFLRKKILMRTYLTVVIFPILMWNWNHLNINSLKNFGTFNHLINKSKLEFDILGISELRIVKSQSLNTNVSLQNFVIKQISTESNAGGALLYINKRHSYKTRPDLAIYKLKNLNQVLRKLIYPRKATWLLDVFINIHAWLNAHLMTLS